MTAPERLWYRGDMEPGRDVLALVGRVCVAVLFLASAFGKTLHFEQTVEYMANHGVPMAGFFCVAAVILEALGGLSLVLGFHARWGALALIGFLVPTTLIFHSGPGERTQFLKNLAILGALLQVTAFGPGGLGMDKKGAPPTQ